MLKEFRPAHPYSNGVSASTFRKRLSHYVAQVRHGNDFVCIRRRGEENVYLISQADWDLLRQKIVDLESGTFDPKVGARTEGLWALLNWEYRWEQAGNWLDARRRAKVQKEPVATSAKLVTMPEPLADSDDRDAMTLVDSAMARLEELDRIKPMK